MTNTYSGHIVQKDVSHQVRITDLSRQISRKIKGEFTCRVVRIGFGLILDWMTKGRKFFLKINHLNYCYTSSHSCLLQNRSLSAGSDIFAHNF